LDGVSVFNDAAARRAVRGSGFAQPEKLTLTSGFAAVPENCHLRVG
jgi:hypothetical protein